MSSKRLIQINGSEFSLKEVEYIVAHRGLFQRAPIEEYAEVIDHPVLWRAVLDKALLDYIKGPREVGKEFARVSAWLYDKDDSGDFGTVCSYAMLEEDTVHSVFRMCRYERLE